MTGIGPQICSLLEKSSGRRLTEAAPSLPSDLLQENVALFIAGGSVWPSMYLGDAERLDQCVSKINDVSLVESSLVKFAASYVRAAHLIRMCKETEDKQKNIPHVCEWQPIINAFEESVEHLLSPYKGSTTPYPYYVDVILDGVKEMWLRHHSRDFSSQVGRIYHQWLKNEKVHTVNIAGKVAEVHNAGPQFDPLILLRIEKGARQIVENLSISAAFSCMGPTRSRPISKDCLNKKPSANTPEGLRLTRVANALGHKILVKNDDPQHKHNCFYESLSGEAESVEVAEQKPTRLLNGWRFLDLRKEKVRIGDRLIYFSYIPSYDDFAKYYLYKAGNANLAEKYLVKREWGSDEHRMHSVEPYPYLWIQHAAVVTKVDESGMPIMARHKFDAVGPLTEGSPFDIPAEYGDVFAVVRKNN